MKERLESWKIRKTIGIIEEKFDLGYHTKHVDTIFERVFGEA